MNFVTGLIVGVFSTYFIDYFVKRTQRDAAAECRGDCGKCTAHCSGYHCYVLRMQPEEVVIDLDDCNTN